MLNFIKMNSGKNLSILLSGTVLAQLIPILLMPLLTRIYDAQAFGIFSVFVGIASVISVSATLRFELAIPQAKDDLAAKCLFLLSLSIVAAVTIFLIIFVTLTQSHLYGIFKLDESFAAGFFYLLVASFFCSGIIQASTNRSIRLSDFSGIALGKVIISTGYALTQLLMGFLLIPAGLIIGYVVGQLLGAIYFFKKSSSWLVTNFTKSRLSELKIQIKEYKNLPLYSAPSAVIDAFCSTLPILVIAAAYDLTTAGMFGMAHRVVGLPTSLLSLSVSQLIFQKVASCDGLRPGFIRNILIRSSLGLASIIIPFALTIYFFGSDLFAFVLGEEWRLAGSYAEIIIIGISVHFLASPNSVVLTLKENIKIGALWQCLRLITLPLVLFFAYEYDFELFLWLFVAHEVVIYLLYIWLIFIGAQRRATNTRDF